MKEDLSPEQPTQESKEQAANIKKLQPLGRKGKEKENQRRNL
jgi:hypothetical protein